MGEAARSSGVYRRRQPETTVLYEIVREHLETFLAQGRGSDGEGYPHFVEREFRRYLDCGLLCHGFARPHCPRCGFERLVAFSCKGKLCPSCLARRTADMSAWLVDHLLPEAGYRQWVLTFPWTLRFRLAADRALLTALLRIFLKVLFAWQRRRGRALGIRDGQTGAITFVQRFGGALNL
ncbi:MAG: transposase zinc-binding domain-containing protein [Candidatus Eisenbacteria bacterium]|nr:transposase zinc-binding domain-containing protein [Candidatus Eisenbacteria bacterium]MBU1948946.1 transposase zinc-binding domain-containing protein [Candidatus Eisenbacteria bacterium]